MLHLPDRTHSLCEVDLAAAAEPTPSALMHKCASDLHEDTSGYNPDSCVRGGTASRKPFSGCVRSSVILYTSQRDNRSDSQASGLTVDTRAFKFPSVSEPNCGSLHSVSLAPLRVVTRTTIPMPPTLGRGPLAF